MSGNKYHFTREGNHIKLSSRASEPQTIHKKRRKWSVLSLIGNVFSLLFSGLIVFIGFLIATPFFILSVLVNWIRLSIGFAIFWFFADLVYTVVIIDSQDFEPFHNTSILIIMGLGLLASIFVTIAEIRE